MATSVRNGDGMSQLQSIDHIVVLMLENRSFDCLLGKLYPKSDTFEGLSGSEQNPDAHGASITVWNNPGTDEATMRNSQSGSRRAVDRHQHPAIRRPQRASSRPGADHGRLCQKLSRATAAQSDTDL